LLDRTEENSEASAMQKSRLKSVVAEFLAAPETDPELIRKYISDLESRNEKITKRIGADSVLVVLFAIFFLLISAKGVGEFSLFGVKITRYDAFKVAIPPIMAGLFARISSGANTKLVFTDVYFEISRQAYPAFHSTSLDSLALPSGVPFTDAPDIFWKGSKAWSLGTILGGISILSIFELLPVTFFAYAYYILFGQYHVTNVFVLLSLVCSVLLYGLGLAMIFLDVWEADAKNDSAGVTEAMTRDE
jgi:hypothetical protein